MPPLLRPLQYYLNVFRRAAARRFKVFEAKVPLTATMTCLDQQRLLLEQLMGLERDVSLLLATVCPLPPLLAYPFV